MFMPLYIVKLKILSHQVFFAIFADAVGFSNTISKTDDNYFDASLVPFWVIYSSQSGQYLLFMRSQYWQRFGYSVKLYKLIIALYFLRLILLDVCNINFVFLWVMAIWYLWPKQTLSGHFYDESVYYKKSGRGRITCLIIYTGSELYQY